MVMVNVESKFRMVGATRFPSADHALAVLSVNHRLILLKGDAILLTEPLIQ